VYRTKYDELSDLFDTSAEDTAISLGFEWGLVQQLGGHSALPTAADLPAGLNLDLTLVRNAAVLWTLTAQWNADPTHHTSITPAEYFSWYGLGPATNTLGVRLRSIGDAVMRGLMVADGLELAELGRSLGAAAVSKVLTRELTDSAALPAGMTLTESQLSCVTGGACSREGFVPIGAVKRWRITAGETSRGVYESLRAEVTDWAERVGTMDGPPTTDPVHVGHQYGGSHVFTPPGETTLVGAQTRYGNLSQANAEAQAAAARRAYNPDGTQLYARPKGSK
jgi:hypothetical protein